MGKGVRERSGCFTFVKVPGGLQKRMRGMNTAVLLAFNPSSLFQFQCTPTASRKHPSALHSQPGICPTAFGADSATLGSWFLITALPTLHQMVCLLGGQRPILCDFAFLHSPKWRQILSARTRYKWVLRKCEVNK